MNFTLYKNIASIVVICFFVTFLTVLYDFPIYPDEVATRFWLSRFLFDFPYKISNLPTCESAFIQVFPLSWYVPGALNWFLHGNIKDLHILRLIGFLTPFVWLSVLFFVLKRAFIQAYSKQVNIGYQTNLWLGVFFISLISLGVYPVFLFTNRHEQLMLPAIVCLVLVFMLISGNKRSNGKKNVYFLILLYLVCVSLILYAHPKGMFLAPFYLFIGLALLREIKNIFVSGSVVALTLFAILQSYIAWKSFFSCPEVPKLNQLIISFSFDPLSFFYDFSFFIEKCLASIHQFDRYLYQNGFQSITDINYLPSHPLGPMAILANCFIYTNIVLCFFCLIIGLPFFYIIKDVSRGEYLTINAVLITLLFSVFLGAVFNLPKNWYDAGYVYSLLIIILIFFIAANLPGKFPRLFCLFCFFYFVSTGLLSQIVFMHRYSNDLKEGYAGPGVKISEYSYDANRFSELSDTAELCKLDVINGKHLIVDDYTYFHFASTIMPMPITYIFLENDSFKIQEFIHESNSSGMIVRCDYMPSSIISVSKRHGGLCCISQENLQKISLMH
jgi:hypothetical protein